MRAVDFSPSGDYFVIVSTGAYSAGTLCDTASRWESNATGSNLQPSWVDYTGGDTLTAVTITGTAVYVGGHQRWQNNPFAGDRPGPGAVPREGIAALDPVNGLPFSWDPGRARGVGVFDLYSTPLGLWVGSDTDQIGGETHRKIAFLPTAGGAAVPSSAPYGLPGNLYNVPASPGSSLARRTFDGTTMGTRSNVNTPGFGLDPVRGMLALQGNLYYGQSDGNLYARAFDGTAVGPAQQIDLHGLTNFPVASLTGMFFVNGRLYYTVQGDPQLYYRYFTPESRIVGAESWPVPNAGDWSSARGITLASGKVYFARTDGTLYRVDFVNGAPVSGTQAVVSPASAGYNWASRGLFVFGQPAQDSSPPTTPGKPTGQGSGSGSVTISWSGSTDASPPITYRVYRDGGSSPIGSTTTTSFTDSGLTPGSSHTYAVDASDRFGNVSPKGLLSDPIGVSSTSVIFADDFSSGTFSSWTGVTNLTVDSTMGGGAPPSARANPSGQLAYAYRNLASPVSGLTCVSARISVTNLGTGSPVLMRLRTTGNGPVARTYLDGSGVLRIRSDASGAQISSGVALGPGWHLIELCGTVGTNATWTLYRDGVAIVDAWPANTGTTQVGRIEIGDTAAKTFTVNFDDVVVDQQVG
jgi:hypothetical protein